MEVRITPGGGGERWDRRFGRRRFVTDIAPAGGSPTAIPKEFTDPGRKLWHSSPGSAGR